MLGLSVWKNEMNRLSICSITFESFTLNERKKNFPKMHDPSRMHEHYMSYDGEKLIFYQ